MSEEKRKILEMIESGKISADEGLELLNAIDESEYDEFVNENMFSDKNEADKENDEETDELEKEENKRENENKSESFEGETYEEIDEDEYSEKRFRREKFRKRKKFDKGFDKFSEKFDKWDDKFSERFSFLGEEIAKKTQVFSEKVLDKVEQILDGNPFENFWEAPEKQMSSEKIELPSNGIEEIDFHAINGKIVIQESISDKIILEVKYALKNSKETLVNDAFSYSIEENKLIFNPTMRDNISLNLYAFLPAKQYTRVSANSKNGRVEIRDLTTEILNINTKNAGIKISASNISKINSNTKNGKIIIDDVKAYEMYLTTANSSISLDDIQCHKAETFSQNGQIILNDVVCNDMSGKTTNASIKLIDCKCETIDYETSNGKIVISDLSTVELKSLKLHTSNSSINTKFANNNKYFYINAFTSQGDINLNLPNLEYVESNKTLQGNKKVVGKNYSDNVSEDEIINITASSSNGAINIQ